MEYFYANGINYRDHLYVPESDADTKKFQYDREEHNHVLKQVTASFRMGSIREIDLRFFGDALQDPNTGLTYTSVNR